MLKTVAFVTVLALSIAATAASGSLGKDTPAAEADRIRSLPGLNPFPTDYSMYSGYVTVNAASQRRLFYWMVTSKADSTNAPLVMWLNGGPGCRSAAPTHSHTSPSPLIAMQLPQWSAGATRPLPPRCQRTAAAQRRDLDQHRQHVLHHSSSRIFVPRGAARVSLGFTFAPSLQRHLLLQAVPREPCRRRLQLQQKQLRLHRWRRAHS